MITSKSSAIAVEATDSTRRPIVIDNGSHSIKVGVAGEALPYLQLPTVAAHWQETPVAPTTANPRDEMVFLGQHDYYHVGENALRVLQGPRKKEFVAHYPLCDGRVDSWSDLERIWGHAIHHDLGMAPEEQPILMNSPPYFTNKENCELLESMMEGLNAEKVNITDDATLALFSHGLTSGTVLSLGHSTAELTPVRQGFALHYLTQHLDLSMTGHAATQRMRQLLLESESGYTRDVARVCGIGDSLAQQLKEKYCYTAIDYGHKLYDFQAAWGVAYAEKMRFQRMALGPKLFPYDTRKQDNPEYIVTGINLQDGLRDRELMFGAERIAVFESLFDPRCAAPERRYRVEENKQHLGSPRRKKAKLVPVSERGLAGQITSLLELVRQGQGDDAITDSLVVTGGNTCPPGFVERLRCDLERHARESGRTAWSMEGSRLLAGRHPMLDVWRGGSVLALHPTIDWITKKDYAERGTRLVKERLWLRS